MINLIETPQRADITATYETNGDILTVTMGETIETFDFTGLPEGTAEEIVAEILPVNPVVAVEKVSDIVNVTVIRFYSAEDKALFEEGVVNVSNQVAE